MADRPPKNDFIARGSKKTSQVGTGLLIVLRLLDIPLQNAILGQGLFSPLLHKVGVQTVPLGPPVAIIGLSPQRAVLLSMAIGSALKQIYWATAIQQEELSSVGAALIALLNTVFNSLNTIMFTCALTSTSVPGEALISRDAPLSSGLFLFGTILYTVGILTETIAEAQRKAFKQNSKNKGKVYTGGLFSLARHINYGGYVLWRGGFALASGGWTWGTIIAGFCFYDFVSRGVPELDNYCQDRVRYL